jgi:hypothetical protein
MQAAKPGVGVAEMSRMSGRGARLAFFLLGAPGKIGQYKEMRILYLGKPRFKNRESLIAFLHA